MNFFIGLLASIAVAQAAPYTGHYSYPAATTLVRAPEHDSAFVRSDRFGGNFAYSIAQRHAYQVFTPNTVALYNHDPFGFSHHQFNQFPFGASVPVPGHHYYIQHPFNTPVVPSFVVYPNQPAQYPEKEEPIESTVDIDSTENPDAENVVIVSENAGNGGNDVNREETTEENFEESNDTSDDSITVDAYRFGGDN